MDLFEYQARDMFEAHGVPVLAGAVISDAAEAAKAAERVGAASGGVVVVKAQVKTGGRGKAGGVKVVLPQRDHSTEEFGFMSSAVSSEKPQGLLVRQIAQQMREVKAEGGKVLWVGGPAVVHTGAAPAMVALVEAGYVDVLFAGNALATHDIEASLYGTSLGVDLAAGKGVDDVISTVKDAKIQPFAEVDITRSEDWRVSGDVKLNVNRTGVLGVDAGVKFENGWITIRVSGQGGESGPGGSLTIEIPFDGPKPTHDPCPRQKVELLWQYTCDKEETRIEYVPQKPIPHLDDGTAVDPATLAVRELARQVREDERLVPVLLPVSGGLLCALKK